jgi:hypothetical protein
MTALQNAGLTAVLVAVGALRDATGGFRAVGLGLAGLGLAAALLGLVVARAWARMRQRALREATWPAAVSSSRTALWTTRLV